MTKEPPNRLPTEPRPSGSGPPHQVRSFNGALLRASETGRARSIPTYENPQPPAVRILIKGLAGRWFHPQRRAALWALTKSTLLIAALWQHVWMWHTKFYSRQIPEVPLSIAWSLLTVISAITIAQVGCSAVLKARSARLRKLTAVLSQKLTTMLAEYISNGDFEEELNRLALESTDTFEECMTGALLSTRGAAQERLCELPAMSILRDRWIAKLHNRRDHDRRYAVEHLALLRDPQATLALEYVLDDRCDGVVAAAARGLLRMPGYLGRDALIRSLPSRPYLVQVLTAGDSDEEVPQTVQLDEKATSAVPLGQPILTAAAAFPGGASLSVESRSLALRHLELQLRAQAVEDAIRSRRSNTTRIGCSVLAASGAKGRDVLRTMSATGAGGDSPAEALSGLLAAAARGGRG